MRRIVLLVAVVALLTVGLAGPAAGAPDKSPMFVEEPFFFEIEFPNPCLGDDVFERWYFEGSFYFHEFANPSGNFHHNDVAYLSAWTDSGFSMPERMVGPEVENISDQTITFTSYGLYQLRSDDGQKLRLQLKIQTTVVDEGVKVDMFGLDFACLGNNR